MITTLPFELIVLIAVELGDDVRSLARFAQTCKYIHTALRPLRERASDPRTFPLLRKSFSARISTLPSVFGPSSFYDLLS